MGLTVTSSRAPARSAVPSTRPKKRKGTLARPASAPAPRRPRAGRKRAFRRFVLIRKMRPVFPGGSDEPLPELSINAFKLTPKSRVLGMDGVRRATQRRIIWYWRFSRGWQKVTRTQALQPEKSLQIHRAAQPEDSESPGANQTNQWYWQWSKSASLPVHMKQHIRRYFTKSKFSKPKLSRNGKAWDKLTDLSKLMGPNREG